MSEKPLLLIVDDIAENIDILSYILRNDYDLKVALSGAKALEICQQIPRPEMVLLDVMMPEIDGMEVCSRLKEDPATSDITVIFVSALGSTVNEEKGFELGAVDFISKPISPSIVKARIKTHLALANQKRELEQKVEERLQEVNQTRLKIIQRLGRAAEYRDNETGYHVIRMSHYTRLIAEAYGGNDEWVEMIFNAAPMHDVGKIGIPDKILLKPGKLDADEWEIMKKHSAYGAEIIGEDSNPLLKMSRTIALSHHERWDGSGYPEGLSGEAIPLEARIVAIADVFDALTSMRQYKDAWSVEKAVDHISQSRGAHFDPHLVDLFELVLPQILEVKANYQD